MSTDFDLVCNTCKQRIHLGQQMAAIPSFGYGSKDLAGTMKRAGLILSHLSHDLRIYGSQDGPEYEVELEGGAYSETPFRATCGQLVVLQEETEAMVHKFLHGKGWRHYVRHAHWVKSAGPGVNSTVADATQALKKQMELDHQELSRAKE